MGGAISGGRPHAVRAERGHPPRTRRRKPVGRTLPGGDVLVWPAGGVTGEERRIAARRSAERGGPPIPFARGLGAVRDRVALRMGCGYAGRERDLPGAHRSRAKNDRRLGVHTPARAEELRRPAAAQTRLPIPEPARPGVRAGPPPPPLQMPPTPPLH